MTKPNSCEDCGCSEGVTLYCCYPAKLCGHCAEQRNREEAEHRPVAQDEASNAQSAEVDLGLRKWLLEVHKDSSTNRNSPARSLARSSLQVVAAWLRYFEMLEYAEIAERLEVDATEARRLTAEGLATFKA